MTQPIVSDKMVEVVGSNLYIYWNDVNEQAKSSYRKKVQLALEAAMAVQKVITVRDIEALIDVWKDDAPTYYVDALRKLLPKAIVGEGD